MLQQEIVLVGQKIVVLDIRRIKHVLRIIALKLTACVATAVHFLNSSFFEN